MLRSSLALPSSSPACVACQKSKPSPLRSHPQPALQVGASAKGAQSSGSPISSVQQQREVQLTKDEIWRQLWACFRLPSREARDPQLRRGFIGCNFTINPKVDGPNSEKLGWLPAPKVWYRAFTVPEDDTEEVHHTNIKEGGGESTVPRSDGLIEAQWEFTKAEHNDDLGFHHPNAQPMTMITLTDTLTVGLPLQVMGWPERAHLESSGPPGDIKTDPASVYSWWCETFFLAEPSGQGSADPSGRTSVGIVYSALPESSVMVRSNIWEPALLEMQVTEEPINLRGALEATGKTPQAPLTSDPSTWLQPLFGPDSTQTVRALAKQVRVDYERGKLMQQAVTCELSYQQQPQPQQQDGPSRDPLLDPWTADNSATFIRVPSGYQLFTYADGAYMICTQSLKRTLQEQGSLDTAAARPVAACANQGGSDEACGSETPQWAMEVGVAGYNGRWCRVRTYLREGRVERWHVLEYLP